MILLRLERGEIHTRKLKLVFDHKVKKKMKTKTNKTKKMNKNQSSMTAVETNMETSFAETNTVQYQNLSHKGL